MSTEHWRNLIGAEDAKTLIANMKKELPWIIGSRKSPAQLWDTDQTILTRLILKSRLCSLPGNHRLWATVGLTPDPFDDSSQCYHGREYNCHGMRRRTRFCRWWHFEPKQTEQQLRDKYDEIVNHWH